MKCQWYKRTYPSGLWNNNSPTSTC